MNCKNKVVLFWLCSLFSALWVLLPWFESPLEQGNWIFLILFFVMLVRSVPQALKNVEHYSLSSLWAAVPAAGIYAGGFLMNVNAAVVAGGIGLWWSVAWLLGGWRTAWRFLPAFTILLLATPGVGYWLGVFTGLEPWIVKTVVCGLAIVWYFSIRQWSWIIDPERVLFLAALLLCAAGYFFCGAHWQSYEQVNPDFFGAEVSDFFGRELEPDAADRSFFVGSTIRRYYFAAPDDGGIDVLEVSQIADVHQIHPAGYCLRAGGFAVDTDVLREVMLPDGRTFQVNSLTAERDGWRILVWNWYERPGLSTGSFLRFRRGGTQNWRSILLSTVIEGADGQPVAERKLAEFVGRIAGAAKL